MIHDPERRGRALGRLYAEVAPNLFRDLEESGILRGTGGDPDRARERSEWDCFALYACIRGLVAAGGFNQETARAIDALHEAVLEDWMREGGSIEAFQIRRALASERYAEYGEIGQAGGKRGAATVAQRLGEAAARHMSEPHPPPEGLAEMVGHLHEALAEGAAEAVRRGE